MSWVDEAIENGWKRVNSEIDAETQSSRNKQQFESEEPVTKTQLRQFSIDIKNQ